MNVMLLKLGKKNIKYIRCIEIVEQTKRRLKANSNYDMCIDNLLFNMTFIVHNQKGQINEENNRGQI